MILLETIFWLLAAVIAYVYLGYPLLLLALRAVRGPRAVAVGDGLPRVTLMISAYNEAQVIEAKLRNSLGLDYPADLLEILVVSDASDDGTDDIVRRYADRGVRLIRMASRGGKTLGLNEGVGQATGEIIVFSDANAMYDGAAIRKLVRNFADVEVGAAVGESRYAPAETDADASESSYWRYEGLIKRLESDIGSVVGGDGAIYAIRRACYQPMPADALSDFVNPLQIVQQGFRCVYEPEAFSVEGAAGRFDKEFRRKVRIVNRAWRAMLRMREMLNPARHGLFSVQLVSHKLLRWLVPVFLIALFVICAALAGTHPIYSACLALQSAFYALALTGFALRQSPRLPRVLSVPFYFCLVNAASLKGIAEAHLGKSYTTWTTARAD